MDRFVIASSQADSAEALVEQLAQLRSDVRPEPLRTGRVDLCLSYEAHALPGRLASALLRYCETNLRYFDGARCEVVVFNRHHKIPRKQLAMGDPGTTYAFSGNRLSAECWDPVIKALRQYASAKAGCDFNFVLINRYADGNDYIAEHMDNEADMDPEAPIASLSIGQPRDFVFRHKSRRNRLPGSPEPWAINLGHGSLLIMHPPTNRHWYHSLPKRLRCYGVRLNFTFRKMRTV